MTNSELLQQIYSMNFNVPVPYVRELHDRFAELLPHTDTARTTDPRQLELPL